MAKEKSNRAEHRKSRRRRVRLKVTGLGETIDVAAGGLSLQSEKKLRVGEVLNLHIVIPGAAEPVTCAGKVLWMRQRSPQEKIDVGISFQKTMPIFHIPVHKTEKRTRSRHWGVIGIGICLAAGALFVKYLPLLGRAAFPLGVGLVLLFFVFVAIALSEIAEDVVR